MSESVFAYPLSSFKSIHQTLAKESDRACIVLAAAWIDELLKVKLMNEGAYDHLGQPSCGEDSVRPPALLLRCLPHAQFHAQACCRQHVDECIEAELVYLAP
jgi:hypothetical protein